MLKSFGRVALLMLVAYAPTVFADYVDNDPCLGPTALLSVVDRPSNSDSVCAVANKKSVLELGLQYQKLYPSGYGYDLPEAEYRLGLPAKNELFILLPNYLHQTISPGVGYAATVVGLKHELSYNHTLQTAVEGEVILPSGGSVFGSNGTGGAVIGIISYTFNQDYNLTFQLGVVNATTSNVSGGQRFSTVNPDAVFTWNVMPTLDVYGEVYGQSRTAPNQGSGFNCDAGIVYLLKKNLTVDLEVGQRISGKLQGFNHYVGTGLALQF